MAFGIASAPAIWQRTIEQILSGIPGTQRLLDDMIITGSTDEEHLNNLESVLKRLNQYGLKANIDKCEFFKDSVTFCGHVIDKHGLHKTPDKIKAIKNAPAPENVAQLKSILGLINYYAKFLPDLSATLSPLHNLRKDTTWKWTKECQEAFDKVKDLITSDMILTHFNPELPVTLACDASPYGLGAVISPRYPNGSDRPIAFASRSLAPAENYSQIDKEALGIIWGIKKFHSYLRNELTVHQGCLMWGVRVIIPSKFRSQVLGQIHEGHLGVVKMKALARSFVWWPGIDHDIEKLAKACNGCQQNQNSPNGAPLNAWEWPSKPWDRVHIDFAGPFLGSMFLIMVDTHSKWPEVIKMKNITSESTINVLRTIFSRNGMPSRIVSDNGPQFTSQEFENFMQLNGIKHTRSAPYHPSTNGLAERFVQTFKQALKSSSNDSGTVSKKLAVFVSKP
ncbi:Uncharacterized protein K02A2.6 [Mytilus coruscus]|uniref:Uncharacterized protein K02A2.6 n=1 Tax=Mytilus coruscus TaxID=42192 RepID=A0A6J8E9K3_MYTCO|nr:Uncharacterized protein K02A2.6 [Mytilus coruscus]